MWLHIARRAQRELTRCAVHVDNDRADGGVGSLLDCSELYRRVPELRGQRERLFGLELVELGFFRHHLPPFFVVVVVGSGGGARSSVGAVSSLCRTRFVFFN